MRQQDFPQPPGPQGTQAAFSVALEFGPPGGEMRQASSQRPDIQRVKRMLLDVGQGGRLACPQHQHLPGQI